MCDLPQSSCCSGYCRLLLEDSCSILVLVSLGHVRQLLIVHFTHAVCPDLGALRLAKCSAQERLMAHRPLSEACVGVEGYRSARPVLQAAFHACGNDGQFCTGLTPALNKR